MKHLWIGVACLALLAGTAVADIVDDFEDGNMDEWTMTPDPVGYQITAAAAHDGALGCEVYSTRTGWLWRDDPQAHCGQGNTVACWTKLNVSSWTRNYFGFGASAGGCYSAVLGDNTNTLIIQYNAGFGYETIADTPFVFINGYWYLLEVDWVVGGTITANLYDSDGVTLLATVTAVDNRITEGGVAMRTFGDSYDPGCWDTITRDGLVPTESNTWGSIKAMFQ